MRYGNYYQKAQVNEPKLLLKDVYLKISNWPQDEALKGAPTIFQPNLQINFVERKEAVGTGLRFPARKSRWGALSTGSRETDAATVSGKKKLLELSAILHQTYNSAVQLQMVPQ